MAALGLPCGSIAAASVPGLLAPANPPRWDCSPQSIPQSQSHSIPYSSAPPCQVTGDAWDSKPALKLRALQVMFEAMVRENMALRSKEPRWVLGRSGRGDWL